MDQTPLDASCFAKALIIVTYYAESKCAGEHSGGREHMEHRHEGLRGKYWANFDSRGY